MKANDKKNIKKCTYLILFLIGIGIVIYLDYKLDKIDLQAWSLLSIDFLKVVIWPITLVIIVLNIKDQVFNVLNENGAKLEGYGVKVSIKEGYNNKEEAEIEKAIIFPETGKTEKQDTFTKPKGSETVGSIVIEWEKLNSNLTSLFNSHPSTSDNSFENKNQQNTYTTNANLMNKYLPNEIAQFTFLRKVRNTVVHNDLDNLIMEYDEYHSLCKKLVNNIKVGLENVIVD